MTNSKAGLLILVTPCLNTGLLEGAAIAIAKKSYILKFFFKNNDLLLDFRISALQKQIHILIGKLPNVFCPHSTLITASEFAYRNKVSYKKNC
jgi:hypothetical protein